MTTPKPALSWPFTARRLPGNPIIDRYSAPWVGRNINGPSLIVAPSWIEHPLGRYYLYFADHRGTYIRLATADHLEGPWTVHRFPTLDLANSHFPTTGVRPHIASPDVHLDPETETVRMYFHGLDTATRIQHSRVALSHDGIHFTSLPEVLGRPYFRAVQYGGWWYALGMPGRLYRSADGLGGFEEGQRLFDRNTRHVAISVQDDELLVFFSRAGDAPERILCSSIELGDDWRSWHAGPPREVLSPDYPWEGGDEPIVTSVRGWVDEPVRQLRDPAIFCEGDHVYLLYAVAGESGIAIAELEPVSDDVAACEAEGNADRRSAPDVAEARRPRGPRRFDLGLSGLREASVTMAAVLASFGSTLFIEHEAHLSASVLILAVALALSIGRVGQRGDRTGFVGDLQKVLVLPLVAVGATEIGSRMLEHPDLGDTLFVLAVSLTIWVRRFGSMVQRVATLATLPLITMLVVPAGIGVAGSGGNQRWWSALIALVALTWVTLAQLIGRRTGLLPPLKAGLEPPPQERPTAVVARRRMLASSKMALQMAAALGGAFALGRSVFPTHWTWVVLTAFIVCSGNRGRGDVLHKAVMRLVGAGGGTLLATIVAWSFPTHDPWSIVMIFAVLTVALWLRSRSYAYWAAGVTAALALLYGYYGERGTYLLGERLEEIAIGAAIAVVVSWLLLPVRTTDVIRRDLARVLGALTDYLGAMGSEMEEVSRAEARVIRAIEPLERFARVLRLLPPRWRARPDYLPVLTALPAVVAALDAATKFSSQMMPDRARRVVEDARARVLVLRRGLRDRTDPDVTAWAELATALDDLSSALQPVSRATIGTPPTPHDRLRSASERVLGFINRQHGGTWQLRHRLQLENDWESYVLVDTSGRRAVLRWSRDRARSNDLDRTSGTGIGTRPRLATGMTPSGYPYYLEDVQDAREGESPN